MGECQKKTKEIKQIKERCDFFKNSFQLQQFDVELQPLKEVLVEYPITFPPSYPYEEEPTLPQDYMLTRCPAWCDRILMSPSAKNLIIDNNFSSQHYNTIGDNVCMGDHKVSIKPFISAIFMTKFGKKNKVNSLSL